MTPLETIFREHYKYLVRYLMQTVSEQDAEDMAMEAIMRCHEKPYTNIRLVLQITARNILNDSIRSKKRHVLHHKELAFLSGDVDTEYVERVVLERLYEAYTELPVGARTILKLFFEGLKTHEIAARLHLTGRTVLNQKSRAIGLLKDKLRPAY